MPIFNVFVLLVVVSPPTTSEGVRVEHVVVTTTSETHTVVSTVL